MNYTSLEQRMAKSYIDLFPKFVPDENAPVTISEQENFYSILKSIYQLGYDEPLLFVTKLHEDDVYPHRYKKMYGKPELAVNMKKFQNAMDSLLKNMFLIGQNSIPEINKSQKVIFSKLGINTFTQLPSAWTWMAKRPEANIITFSRCFFKIDYPHQSYFYASFFGETSFRKLEKWMFTHGYKKYDIYDINKWHSILSLTYANPLWNKELPKGGFEYKIKHTGISATFDLHYKDPAIFGLCIPNGLKVFLEAFESMDLNLKKFFINQTKKCNNCRYCIQTDKTGSRPLVSITVDFQQEKYNLCPYYPGSSYSWTSINNELVEQLISFLTFMDKFINNEK